MVRALTRDAAVNAAQLRSWVANIDDTTISLMVLPEASSIPEIVRDFKVCV